MTYPRPFIFYRGILAVVDIQQSPVYVQQGATTVSGIHGHVCLNIGGGDEITEHIRASGNGAA